MMMDSPAQHLRLDLSVYTDSPATPLHFADAGEVQVCWGLHEYPVAGDDL